jgi:hypothetical protein
MAMACRRRRESSMQFLDNIGLERTKKAQDGKYQF